MVVTDVTSTVFEKVLLAVVTDVAGIDVETTLMARGDDEQVDGLVATGVEAAVVLAESGSVVFTLLENEGFGSRGAWGVVKTTGVGLTLGGVDGIVLVDGNRVVVLGLTVTGLAADMETEETWF